MAIFEIGQTRFYLIDQACSSQTFCKSIWNVW